MTSGRPRTIYLTCRDLLTTYTEPMSFFDDGFTLGGSKRFFGGLPDNVEYVNPQSTQYPDKHFGTIQQLGFMTPELSPMDATPRRESFALSENRSYNLSGSSGASSFMSHSGCGTPSISTPSSSTSSSRRQSMMLSDNQQCFLPAYSPSHAPQRRKMAAAMDQCLMQESSPTSYITSTDEESLVTEGELTVSVDNYIAKAPRQWPSYAPQNDASLFCGLVAQHLQTNGTESFGRDFAANFSNSIVAPASQAVDLNQPLFDHSQPTIFRVTAPQPSVETCHQVGTSSASIPSLQPAFEYPDAELVDGDILPNDVAEARSRTAPNGLIYRSKRSRSALLKSYPRLSPTSDEDKKDDHSPSRNVKTRNKRHKQGQRARCIDVPKDKKNHCEECDYACDRFEHLKRHKQSKHYGEDTEMHPCAFAGCTDRKTGRHREIIARADNLKAHYTKTHFKYGNSEKGGKNARKSMKAAHEMDLSAYDLRWTLLLGEKEAEGKMNERKMNEGKMNVSQEIEGYLHVWKMLGYSILETRDTKVKSVKADWQGSHHETLQRFDPRWKALWDGSLTFDKAMDTGVDMTESAAQGLLGVTMLESEAMGIRPLDPRWTELDNGRMSVEQSEKLGVKQRNPVWKELVERRRA